MTHRERLLAAFRGQAVDRLPWAPRLDLWYLSHQYCGTLPVPWQRASLMDIVQDLDIAYHAAIPNFLDTANPEEAADRALGLDQPANRPSRLRFRRTKRHTRWDGNALHVAYELPRGTLTAKLVYTEDMRRSGATLLHVEEKVVKSPADYDLLGDLFEDLIVECDAERYEALADQVGDQGPVVAWANVAASPVHHLLKELVPYDRFYFDLHDQPELITRTAARLEGYFHDTLEACCRSRAELVMFGANYDVSLTPPRLFAEHLAPGLARAAEQLHAAGKLLVTHTDGENDGLNAFYQECGVDVADSVCPAPMTRLTLADYRAQWGCHPAIWGGLCSVCVLPESFSEAQFEAHVQAALGAIGDGRGMVFSLADTTPPAASVERLKRIGAMVADWGPVRG